MTTITYIPDDHRLSPLPAKVSTEEKKIGDLQQDYIEAINKYYEQYPPFTKDGSNRPNENQDLDWYLRLVRQCWYSGSTQLLLRWGIKYVQQKNVLTKPKSFYRDIFERYSDQNRCLQDLHIGIIGAFYFKYLYDNFPKD